MKKISLILLSCILLNCSKKEFKEAKWIVFKTKDSIPTALNDELLKYDKSFKIADFKENFNATDLLADSLPTRKIKLLARKDNQWRIVYLQGGFAKYYVLIDCNIEGDSISNFRVAETLFSIENNDSIDKFINDNKLKFKSSKIRL